MTPNNASGPTSSSELAGERRHAARRIPDSQEPLRRVRSRTGLELDVVDVSSTGVLIEGRARLLPNTRLDIHLVTRTGRVLVRCRVIRAYVWYLEGDLVRYRVGLAFDHAVDTAATGGYPLLGLTSPDSAAPGTRYPGDEPVGERFTPLPQSA
jgi:hypothetical protein